MTNYGNPFYIYMRHQKVMAGVKVIKCRAFDKQRSEFQLSEYLKYKKEMKKWRLRIKNSQVIIKRKLGCYNCSAFFLKHIKCNLGHKHLPKITCDDCDNMSLFGVLIK